MTMRKSGQFKIFGAAAFSAAGLAACWFLIRPWHRKWGATAQEAAVPLPGDDLVPQALWRTTHAITIRAPIETVWSWIVQVGQGRGRFYSYDWLENLFGMDIRNTDRILPEYQRMQVGDTVPFWKGVGVTVRQIDPPRLLVLAGSLNGNQVTDGGSWVFVLRELSPGSTRLIVRTRSVYGPFWIAPVVCLIGEPAHFIMERAMLQGIKQRSEGVHFTFKRYFLVSLV